jgi:hypothetical protein
MQEALQGVFRQMLSENLDALRESGELPGVEALRAIIREEVRAALEEVRVPSEETITEIARRESAGEGLEERLQETLKAQVDEKLTAFGEAETLLEDIEKKLESFKTELTGVEEQEDQLQEKFAVLFEGEPFRKAVASLIEERVPDGETGDGGVSAERVGEVVQEVVADRARELEENLRKDLGGKGGPSQEELTETITKIAGATTEKVLAREAEGLVRQIKIELGKLRNDMGKAWEKTVALVKSPEMKKQIETVAKKEIQGSVGEIKKELKAVTAKASSGPGEEAMRDLAEEVSTQVAEEVAQESLKGFLDELRGRVEAGFDTRLNEFMASDDLKKKIGNIARQAAATSGGGGDGSVDIEAIKSIVSEEIVRRTDDAFKDMVPRHVGKFLDDKLPPPEFFQSLATMVQVKQEIEKRMAGSRSGSSARAFSGPGPGESAIFANMIGRLLGSDELKEMIDDKFRVINSYIKSELIPKTIKKMKKDGNL